MQEQGRSGFIWGLTVGVLAYMLIKESGTDHSPDFSTEGPVFDNRSKGMELLTLAGFVIGGATIGTMIGRNSWICDEHDVRVELTMCY